MKDSILWLQLKSRQKPDKNCLYSSIKDIKQWVERISRLHISEQDEHYISLLVEVNHLDIPVNERLIFLESLHQPVINLIDYHSKKFLGSGLPLAEDKSKYVNRVNSYWFEMATAYKIIIDDLSEDSFLTSFINKKDLSYSLYHVLFYLNGQLYSNYMLYSVCTENVWRDIHQIYRFATTKKLTHKTIKTGISEQLSINELYKKILLFSLANPYHLTPQEKVFVWKSLDEWSQHASINFDTNEILKNNYTFIIHAYSDRAPFLNYKKKDDYEPDEVNISAVLSKSIWGIETEKLIKQLSTKNKYSGLSDYLAQRLSRNWQGNTKRIEHRKGLIEPVVITFRASCIAKLLSEIEAESNFFKFDNIEEDTLELTSVTCLQCKAYLIDESKSGFRLKLGHNTEESIIPDIGEVIALKHTDNGIHIGFLRWIRENSQGEIEFGVEHLCAMAEPVQLIKSSSDQSNINPYLENINKLDSFVFPGGNEYNNQPILFTSTFVEKFYRVRSDIIILKHKTGSINIKLVQKVNEVLGYSLYLFEKAVDKSE